MDPSLNNGLPNVVQVDDQVRGNPYLHFAISEFYAALAAGAVHIFGRGVAYLVHWVDQQLPIPDSAAEPVIFFETVMSWGATFATAATFLMITFYQLLVLAKRLSKGFRK